MKRFSTIICLSFLLFPSPVIAETKTFLKEYTYQASEFDSKASSRILALEQVKRLLLEELGTYLISETAVKDFQLTKDQIMLFTAGSVKADVLDEKWDGKAYYLKVKLSADPEEVAQSVKKLSQDKKITKELEGTKKRADDLEKEVIRLRQELTTKADSVKIKQYSDTVNKLSAIEWMQKGFGLLKDGKDADKNKEALEAFNKALELSPEDSDLYFLRAMIFYYFLGSSDYKNMLSDIDKAIGLHPSNKDNSAYKTTAPHLSMKAKIYKDKGNWHKAIQTLENAINLDPDDAITPSGIDPNKPETVKNWSKQDFDEIIKKYPKDYRGYMFRGHYYEFFIFLDNKNYFPAMNDYKKAVIINPKSAFCHYLLGNLYTRRASILGMSKSPEEHQKEFRASMAGLPVFKTVYPEDYKNSILELTKAIQLNPKLIKAYGIRADIYLGAKEYNLAIKDYAKLVELDPDYAGTYHDRAIAYKELGRYEEAIRDLTKAIGLKHSAFDWPRSAYEVRAHVYEAMGKYEDAINDYTKALEVWKKQFGESLKKDFGSGTAYDILDRRAKNYRKLKQYQKAIDDYTEAISWMPAGPPSMVFADRGDAYMELEKPAEAIKDYDLAIESNRKQNKELSKRDSMSKMDTLSSEYLAKKARAYATLEKYDLAFESYNKALNAVDDYPPFKGKIYQEMGMLYRSLGINQEAIKACSLAVKYLPLAGEDPFLAYLELGNAYSDIGDHKEALRVFTEMLKLYPKWAVGYGRRGYEYYDTQDYDRAIIDFNKAIELMPTNQILYYYRGLSFVYSGKFKQGINDIKIAARLGHREAQEKLKEWKIDW